MLHYKEEDLIGQVFEWRDTSVLRKRCGQSGYHDERLLRRLVGCWLRGLLFLRLHVFGAYFRRLGSRRGFALLTARCGHVDVMLGQADG
jgi:hypothetical protein